MEQKYSCPDNYLSYTAALLDPPFGYVDLLDYDDKETGYLKEYNSFDPKFVMMCLIKRAMTECIPPDQFHREMKELLDLHYKHSTSGSEEPESSRRNQLKQKYLVKGCEEEPDAMIRFDRIKFMFPHYYLDNFVSSDGDYPCHLLKRLEFAAIIPLGRLLIEKVRTALVTMHICELVFDMVKTHPKEAIPPIPVLQKMVKHRISIGLLSDQKRVQYLITKQFLTHDLNLSIKLMEKYNTISKTKLFTMISERLM